MRLRSGSNSRGVILLAAARLRVANGYGRRLFVMVYGRKRDYARPVPPPSSCADDTGPRTMFQASPTGKTVAPERDV